jgi:hypothetical protein
LWQNCNEVGLVDGGLRRIHLKIETKTKSSGKKN